MKGQQRASSHRHKASIGYLISSLEAQREASIETPLAISLLQNTRSCTERASDLSTRTTTQAVTGAGAQRLGLLSVTVSPSAYALLAEFTAAD